MYQAFCTKKVISKDFCILVWRKLTAGGKSWWDLGMFYDKILEEGQFWNSLHLWHGHAYHKRTPHLFPSFSPIKTLHSKERISLEFITCTTTTNTPLWVKISRRMINMGSDGIRILMGPFCAVSCFKVDLSLGVIVEGVCSVRA